MLYVSDSLYCEKLDALGYIFVAESLSLSSTNFTQCAPQATEFS